MRQYPQLQSAFYALYAATREAEDDVQPTARREFLCRVKAPSLERLDAGEIINTAAMRREHPPQVTQTRETCQRSRDGLRPA